MSVPFLLLWIRFLSHIASSQRRKQHCTSSPTCTFNARTPSGKNQIMPPGSPTPSPPRSPPRSHRRSPSHPSAPPASPSYRATPSTRPFTATSSSSNRRIGGSSRSSLPTSWKKPSASHATRSHLSPPPSACTTTNTSGGWRTCLLRGRGRGERGRGRRGGWRR